MILSSQVIRMKQSVKEILAAVVLGAVLPTIVFHVLEKIILKQPQSVTKDVLQMESTQHVDREVEVPVLFADGNIQRMNMDTYIAGVVLAEMPAEFEKDALKAQAVVARTYALKRISSGDKHEDHAVCTDSTCCQAYVATEEYLSTGITEEHFSKILQAVQETSSQVLTYDGELIEATYYSCSGGRTEDAVDVWGAEIPYLCSVESPGEEQAEHFTDTVLFRVEEFCSLLSVDCNAVKEDGIYAVAYTDGGGVETLQVGDTHFSGIEIRHKLDLRSTAFGITMTGDSVIITTKGYGHRVGMSQYGAEAMALVGSNYEEILAHYYPGTVLVQWTQN